MNQSAAVIALPLAGIYVVFLVWYGGRGKPMDTQEAEELLAQMRRRAGRDDPSDGPEPTLVAQFRELARSDDGREFWMVNLLAFRERAGYPPELAAGWGDDPMAANSRYNRAIIPHLLRHGGHPVFATRVTGRFINDADAPIWDQVAVVRYRSRRDMLRMAVDLAGTGEDVHKWAALERTQVFPVRPYLSLASTRGAVAAVLIIVGLVLTGW